MESIAGRGELLQGTGGVVSRQGGTERSSHLAQELVPLTEQTVAKIATARLSFLIVKQTLMLSP